MSLFGSGRREGLLAVLTLLLLSITVHARGLFLDSPRQQPQTRSFAEHARESFTNEDTLIPALRDAAAVVQGGEVPLWNPKSRFGEPFELSGAPVVYLPYWLMLFDGGLGNLELLLCLHTFLACMAMYRFCRASSISRYVGFCAGALYGLGWCMQAQLDRLPHAAVLAILPLALEATWRVLVSHRRDLYAAWLAIILTMMFATGGTTTASLGALLCVAVFVYHLWAMDLENRRAALRGALVCAGLTTLLTAPLWLHVLSHLSHLGELGAAAGAQPQHLQLAGLFGALSPGMFGGITGQAPEALRLLNPSADPLELLLFPGSCACFVGIMGLLRPKRTSRGLLWVSVLGLGLLVSMDSPIMDLLAGAAWLPALSPGIGLGFVHLALVVLIAISLESFFEAPMARPLAVPIAAGVTIILAAVAFTLMFVVPGAGRSLLNDWLGLTARSEVQTVLHHLRMQLLPTLLFAAAIAGLFLIWRKLGLLRFKVVLEVLIVADLVAVATLHVPRAPGTPDTTVAGGLGPVDRRPDGQRPDGQHPDGRIPADRIPMDRGRGILAGRPLTEDAAPLRRAGLATVTTTSPAILARTTDFLRVLDPSMIQLGTRARVLPLQTIPILNSPLLDIAGVGVVIARGEAAGQGFHILAPAPEVEIKRGVADGVHLRTVNARRARLMFQAVAATSRADAIDKLRSYEFQLADTMIVEGARDGFVCRKPDGEPEIAFSLDRANKITLRVDMAGGQGYLLLADAFAPGWYAWVDGSPATIHPADVAMRGVALPAGKHEVTFVYRPLGWRLGVPLAAVGLLLLSMWVARVRFVERRRRRRRADQVARVSQQAIAAKAAAQGEQAARAAQAAQLAQLTQAAQAAQAAQAGQAGPPAGAE